MPSLTVQQFYQCSQNINDWILALIVLLLVGIDVFILTIYMAVDGAQGMLGPTTLPDRETFEIITGVSN